MTDPWYTTNLTLAVSLFAAAAIARLARWISRRTFAALWGLAITLNAARALTQERHWAAAASFAAALLMAWVWWDERPLRGAPMPPALRYAHTALAATTVLTAGAAYLAHTGHWLAAAALLYTAALAAWIATREYANHRRTVAEHQWARRRALGEQPPPLDPCCYLGRATRGTAHDHRCTDVTTRQTDRPETAA